MSKLKGLKTLAEELQGSKALGRAVPEGRMIHTKPPGDFSAVDDMVEYERVQGQLDKLNEAPATPKEVQAEISRRAQEAHENSRLEAVTSPKAEFSGFQTRSPEEYAVRLENQLRNPEYAFKSLGGSTGVTNLLKSQEIHKTNVENIFTPLEANPRWKQATDSWFGDSPYKGDVQFHVDRFTDPTRPNSFIQFEEPREFGLHSGTNDAAERIIHRGGIEELMKEAEEQTQAFAQMADELDMPLKRLERKLAVASEAHLVQRFTKEPNLNIWDEVTHIVDQFVIRIGMDRGKVSRLIDELKNTPNPSTMPFLFRGRNGLLLEDTGGFKAMGVAQQLESIFPSADDILAIDEALGALGETARQGSLIKFMESKGYDHIVYFNSVEDKGSLSLINWNPDLMASPWDPRFARGPQDQARMASQYILSALGLGGASAGIRNDE